jgi:D-alanine-D-alanine ligase
MHGQSYGKVAVLMGGNTTEREISLISGQAILNSLRASGVDAHAFDPAAQPIENLRSSGYKRALVMIHGRNGEDGKLQGALEYLGIPYTGSGVMASAIGMDKYRTRLIWQSLGIPVAAAQYIEKSNYQSQGFVLTLQLPVVVKPADDGSTLGLSKVYKLEDLAPAIKQAFVTSSKVLVEELIVGEEFTITICDGVPYPLIKIIPPDGEYDYQNKYFSDATKYLCPVELGPLQTQIEQWALAGYHAIGACGIARLDFMLNAQQEPFFLEINTIPGMTTHSLVPLAMQATGVNFAQLCLKILDGASLGK